MTLEKVRRALSVRSSVRQTWGSSELASEFLNVFARYCKRVTAIGQVSCRVSASGLQRYRLELVKFPLI